MKSRTAAAVLVLLGALIAGGYVGLVAQQGERGTLTTLWVSDTSRDAIGNHHAPAVASSNGETIVIAPVNAPRASGDCALVAFTPEQTARWQATVQPEACNIHAFGDPTIADLDGDGVQEVFVATTEYLVHAYSLESGETKFTRELNGWGYVAPVVTDFTPSPGKELIVADISSGVFVYSSNGSLLWNRSLSGTIAPLFVADFTGDGTQELAIGEGRNVTLLGPDGQTIRQTPVGGGVNWLTVGQTNAADAPGKLVAGTSTGRVVAVDAATGEIVWSRDFGRLAAVHAFGDGDDDGQAELYAVAKDGVLRALDARDGTTEWTVTLTTSDVQMTPPPALGDLDGDGVPELVTVSQDGMVSILDPRNGERLASYERDVPIWMRPTLADLDSNGDQEVLITYGDGRVVALAYDS